MSKASKWGDAMRAAEQSKPPGLLDLANDTPSGRLGADIQKTGLITIVAQQSAPLYITPSAGLKLARWILDTFDFEESEP